MSLLFYQGATIGKEKTTWLEGQKECSSGLQVKFAFNSKSGLILIM